MAWTHLGAPNDVVPDGRPAKVNVKVGVAALDAHEAVLLDLAGVRTDT